jgi:predicted AAA+ superfamily ATPase
MIERLLKPSLQKDLSRKVLLLAGPRQCGKTTLVKSLSSSCEYLNFDFYEDKSAILKNSWDQSKQIVIFDELHKMPRWKSWVKGLYDKKGVGQGIVVTGSARLNTYRKFGDSLAGRHFYYRLHPFDLKELQQSPTKLSLEESFQRLMTVSGFPEPFLNGDVGEYNRWRMGHVDLILRQDLLDLEVVRDIRSIELLLHVLRTKVGSPISALSLANEIHKDIKTVQRWLMLLEDVFLIFRVLPYHKNISIAVKKEPKFYFYDTAFVDGDESQKLENLVACALLKECHYQTDTKGRILNLFYLKVRGGKELDFAIIPDSKADSTKLIEVKLSDTEVSPSFKIFSPYFKNCQQIQLVKNIENEKISSANVQVRSAIHWLESVDI